MPPRCAGRPRRSQGTHGNALGGDEGIPENVGGDGFPPPPPEGANELPPPPPERENGAPPPPPLRPQERHIEELFLRQNPPVFNGLGDPTTAGYVP
ncbi:hypothetical protein AAHA92_22477 [Salvia divinorum]|uniref:Uncharacterized protein n=1 Tax=Salvia divinorum TaxID=28513 RepID=A0ABD1GRQ1_SALDI